MKILFINLPYYGHVVPTIGLVKELIAQGCEVTYLLPFDWKDRIAESGATFCGYENHRQLAQQMKNAYSAAERMVGQFDLVVYEQFFFLGKHLAEQHGKPSVRVFTAPATNQALMQAFIAKGPMAVFRHQWIARAFTKDVAKGVPLKTDHWLDEIVCNPPGLNLVYTHRAYQPNQEDFPRGQYVFLGPSIYDRKEEEFAFHKGKRSLIYISLGTVVKGARSFFQTCVEAFRSEDADVIISVGARFNVRKLKNVPANVHIYNHVPQLEVLKMADVFVTHGGMNSVSEALVYKTPMVVIPFASDQPVNAQCVERLGVGKQLSYSAVNQSSLKECVKSVLSDEEIKGNLARVQELIRQSPGNPGGAEAIIRYYHSRTE